MGPVRGGRRAVDLARDARGALLVELALVALILSLLLAGTIELGRAVFASQLVQDAARVAARELALVPAAPDATFEEVLASPAGRLVYDPCRLVIDLDAIPAGSTLDDVFASLPVVNRVLRAGMIVDGIGSRRLLRYPGALAHADGALCPGGEFTVAVPVVTGRSADGVETIRWAQVLEEIRDCADPTAGPFRMANGGVAAVRINYPFQAAMLSGFRRAASALDPNVADVIRADDGAVSASDPCGVVSGGVAGGAGDPGPYSGAYGLGRQLAFGREVRPFRVLLSAQSVFRREVFSGG